MVDGRANEHRATGFDECFCLEVELAFEKLLRDERRGDTRAVLAVCVCRSDLGEAVHRGHGALVDRAFEQTDGAASARQAVFEVGSPEDHGVVAREVTEVVFEYDEVVVLDLGVGGVEVHRADVTGLQASVGEVVVHAAGRILEAVGIAQAGPAVGALHELVAEAHADLGVVDEI